MTKSALRKAMGENIRTQRTNRNMSIDELAELLELTPGFIGLIERGHRGATPFTLYKLSSVFGISIDEIFVGIEEKPIKVSEPSPMESKRTKINSIIFDLTEAELDFIITTIKNLKIMHGEDIEDEGVIIY